MSSRASLQRALAALALGCLLLPASQAYVAAAPSSVADLQRTGPSAEPLPATGADLAQLERLVQEMDRRWSKLDRACDARAPFALLYLVMTREVRAHIEGGYFDDNPFMTSMTVAFAEAYLGTFDNWTSGKGPVAAPWAASFRWAASGQSTVTEDAFLGMNAHINYDLGVVTWSLGLVPQLRKDDFDRINDVMVAAADDASAALARHYDPSWAPGAAAPLTDPATMQVLIGWREQAWNDAVLLTQAPDDAARAAWLVAMEERADLVARGFQVPKVQPTAPDRQAYCEENP